MQDETMAIAAEYNSEAEAEIGKSKLDSVGIWSTIRNEYMSTLYPVGTMPATRRPGRRGRKGPDNPKENQVSSARRTARDVPHGVPPVAAARYCLP